MKSNYRAWDIPLDSFPRGGTLADKSKFLLQFAVLAPSGHNTQPWNFSIAGNVVSLWVNRDRSLEESDPHRRQLMVAFGCMIENVVIAADHYGYKTDIRYFPEPQNPDLVAKIIFDEQPDRGREGDGRLVSAIPLRHTNRSKYVDRPLPAGFWDRIRPLESTDLKIFVITKEAEKHAVADIVNDAQIAAMDSAIFREELSHYVKSSFTKEHVGMPGFVLEIPAPISFMASRMIKMMNLSRKSKEKDDALLKTHTPTAFVVIGSRGNDFEQWLAAGRLLEKIWLIATKEGLNCSPMAAAIQSPIHNQKLRKFLGTDLEPQVFFRIGYAKKQFHHSPRFTVDSLLK